MRASAEDAGRGSGVKGGERMKGTIEPHEDKHCHSCASRLERVGRMYLKLSKASPVIVYVGLAWKSVLCGYGFDYIDFVFCMLLINYVFLREMKAF